MIILQWGTSINRRLSVRIKLLTPERWSQSIKTILGAHGYIYGEITTKGCRIRFVPFAMRSYIHQTIEVNPSMTEHELKETVAKVIDEKERKYLQDILDGMRDPEISYNVDTLDPYGNVIEITDQTRPAYQFDKLKEGK